jgi:hypothetical protein
MEMLLSLGAPQYGGLLATRYRASPGSVGGSTRTSLCRIHPRNRSLGISARCRRAIAGIRGICPLFVAEQGALSGAGPCGDARIGIAGHQRPAS